ncbi:MAG: response regulator [Desulfovibrio sp.]|jgi:CheY-like chemotaxis protein/PAS domain-containing protein|nr:response regulator [Desulfovibrio sp.]
MTKEQSDREAAFMYAPKQLVYGVPALFGLFVAAVVFGLLLYAARIERADLALEQSRQSLTRVLGDMDTIRARAASWAEFAARAVNSRADLAAVTLENAKSLWPEAMFSFYDRSGEIVRPAVPALVLDAPPLPRTARALVHDALIGNTGSGITMSRGFLAVSAAAPVQGGNIRAAVVTVPLDSLTLRVLRDIAMSDLAVIPFGDDGLTPAVSGGAWTFTKKDAVGEQHLGTLFEALPALKAQEHSFALGDDGLTASAVPLYDSQNAPAGLLIVAPLRAPGPVSPLLPAAGACIAGIMTAPAALFLSLRHGNRMMNALAATMASISDSIDKNEDFDCRGYWPAALENVLNRTAEVIKNCRLKARAAEEEKKRLEAVAAERSLPAEEATASGDWQRLFDYAPVGVFRAAKNGSLARVNAAFARLLGYDSPDMLMEEHYSFTDFYAYDDADYLATLAGNEGGGMEAVLRKRNGEAGHYSLFCSPLPDVPGTPDAPGEAGMLECFLLDNEAASRIPEINRARKEDAEERRSMALFLASICRRLQAYLLPGEREERGPEQAAAYSPEEPRADRAAGESRPDKYLAERRHSMLPVRETLYDIYQFAISEAVADPPVDVPMDFEIFLQRFCDLSSYGLGIRGISMRCEAEAELLTRIGASVPLLRQTLRNALLLVTHEMRGGLVRVSVTRDPGQDPAAGFVLFSITWSPHVDQGYSEGLSPVSNFDAEPDEVSDFSPDFGAMENVDEQKLIDYLAGKIGGFVRAAVFSDDMHCIELSIPLRLQDAPDGAGADPGYADSSMYAPGAADFNLGFPSVYDDRPAAGLYDLGEPDTLGDEDDLPGSGTRAGGLDILLADDNLNNRMLFSLFLRGTMHRITEARNGQECVEAFQRGRCDIVFMSMEMPIMDGYQATRIIRAYEIDAGMKATPVVAVTSYAMPEFKRQCRLAGCSDFLARPFSKTALFSLLDAYAQLGRDGSENAGERTD